MIEKRKKFVMELRSWVTELDEAEQKLRSSTHHDVEFVMRKKQYLSDQALG